MLPYCCKITGVKTSTVILKTKETVARFATKTRAFLTADVWDAELVALSGLRRRAVSAVRILLMVARGFKQNECGIRAASLTFISLLSFVPVLALALSVVRMVSYDDSLRENSKEFVRSILADTIPESSNGHDNGFYSDETFSDETDNGDGGILSDDISDEGITIAKIEKLIDTGFDKVDKIDFGTLGGIGLVLFVWAVIGVLGSIELAFNKVWGVLENRTLARKFTDYLSVLIICPLLLAAASSLPALALANRTIDAADAALPSFIGFPVVKATWVLFLLTLAFTFMLRFTPNTKVRLVPGLAGGFVTAVGFAAWLKLCLALQIGVVKYSTFFGGFSMLPIILSWVFVSWEIILFGAEFSYAVQNVNAYPREQGWRLASWKSKLLLAAALLREGVAKVENGDGILRLREFNATRRISARLVREVAHELDKAGYLAAVAEDSESYAFRRDPSEITLGDVASHLLDAGVGPAALGVSRLPEAQAAAAFFGKSFGAGLDAKIKDLTLPYPANDHAT